MRLKNEPVPKVDIVEWLLQSFKVDDFVVLKMHVEGAEHAIVPKMLRSNATALVDVLLWECHPVAAKGSLKCSEMEKRMMAGGINVIFREPYDFTSHKGLARVRRNTPVS